MSPIPDVFTVKQAADEIRVSESTIYRWITQGKIIVRREGRNILIPTDDNLNFFVGQISVRYQRPGSAWVPEEIKAYSEWHQLLDELTWLLKVCYSPREDIKRKQFRLDQLFANYIKFHKIELPKIKRIFASVKGLKRRLITDDLKRGWYNELAFILPLKKSTLGLTFADIELNKATAQTRFAFPSWRITSSYYAVYFYLRDCLES